MTKFLAIYDGFCDDNRLFYDGFCDGGLFDDDGFCDDNRIFYDGLAWSWTWQTCSEMAWWIIGYPESIEYTGLTSTYYMRYFVFALDFATIQGLPLLHCSRLS